MRQVARLWNVRIALVAACILVLQAMTGGLVTGSMASSIERDAFGNPICVTSIDHVGSTQGSGDHHQGTECCTMGCAGTVALAPAPAVDTVALVRATPANRSGLYDFHVPPLRPGHDQASPRAPPRLA